MVNQVNHHILSGYPAIWQAVQYGELCRMSFYSYTPFDLLINNRLTFLISTNFQYKEAFFSPEHYYNPITIHSHMVNVKNTSYAHYDKAVSLATNETLWTAEIQLVTVDTESHRPTPPTSTSQRHI